MNKKRNGRARYGSGSLWDRNGIWWIKWREVKRLPNGVTQYLQHAASTGSTDRNFAQQELRRKLLETGGRRPRVVSPGEVTYEDLRDAFLANAVEEGSRSLYRDKNGKPTVSTITRLDRFFSGWKATDIGVGDLRRFRAETRKELTEAGTNRCMASIRRMFKLAVQDERLTSAEVPGYFPMFKETNEARGAFFIEDEWYEPLRRKLPEPLRSAFVLAYRTGIRVYELRRLRWRNVDLAKRIVTLPGEITKTGKPRTVHIPSDLKIKSGKPDEAVFPLGNFSVAWHDACVAIGAGKYRCRECEAQCEGRVCPAHGQRHHRDLIYVGPLLRHTRHTAVRNMIEAGVSEKLAMTVSGHVTPSMLQRYNIGREKDVEQVREVMERFHRKRRG